MTTDPTHQWNPHILNSSPIYWPLLPFAQTFISAHQNWPGLDDYQNFLQHGAGHIHSASGAPLHFAPQGKKAESIDTAYEPRIYLRGEIQTRLCNWHDFFQVLIWRIFPNTKSTLNQLHYNAIIKRYPKKQATAAKKTHTQRTPIENALTQFDECGAIILSCNKKLLQLIKDFQWKTLFLEHRSELSTSLRCIVFGHAIYEKAISPYIGLTAHSLLLHVDEQVLQKSTSELACLADKLTNEQFRQSGIIKSPQSFAPFPLLGMPGWVPENSQPSFYDNTQYFRPGRQTNKSTVT